MPGRSYQKAMKVLLDIEEHRASFLIELLRSLEYVSIIEAVEDNEKSQAIQDLVDAFQDVKLYEAGKKPLKSAKDLLNEL